MSGKDIGRRSVLASAGTTLVGSIAANTVIANQSRDSSKRFTNIIMESNAVAKEEGLQERQKFLDEKGISHKEKNLQISTEGPGLEGDFQTEGEDPNICIKPNECDADIDVQFSLSYEPRANPSEFHYSYFIKFNYYLNWDSSPIGPGITYLGPKDPVDTLGLTWEENRVEVRDYQRVPDSVITDDYTQFDGGSYTGSGLGILVDGRQAAWDSGFNDRVWDWSQLVTSGVFLVKDVDFRPETSFRGVYEYAWKGTKPDVSVSYPYAISFTGDGYEESDGFQHTPDGRTFHIKAEDVM